LEKYETTTDSNCSNRARRIQFCAGATASRSARWLAYKSARGNELMAIHQEAMTKAKAVIDASLAQIRPVLTPEQQTKLDAIVKAHEDLHNAMKELHDAKGK
jgi:hypothetical protein